MRRLANLWNRLVRRMRARDRDGGPKPFRTVPEKPERERHVLLVLAFLGGASPVHLAAGGPAGVEDEEDAAPESVLRRYDVRRLFDRPRDTRFFVRPQGDLVLARGDATARVEAPLFGDERPAWRNGSEPVDFSELEKEKEARAGFGPGELRDLIRETARPLGVAEPSVTYRRGILFVRSSEERTQEAVRSVVGTLDARARGRFRVECLLVPPESLERVEPAWRAKGPRLASAVFVELLRDPAARLLSATAPAGLWVSGARRNLERLLRDYDVDQTGVIPVSDPVTSGPEGGAWLHARVYPVPERREVLLDLAAGVFDTTWRETQLGRAWSHLDLPVISERLVSVSTLLDEGAALVAGTLAGPEPLVVAVRVRRAGPRPEAPRRAPRGEFYLQAYDAALLLRDPDARRWWPRSLWDDPSPRREPGARRDPGELEHDLAQLFGFEGVAEQYARHPFLESLGGQAFLVGPQSLHRDVSRVIAELTERTAEAAAVELALVDLSRERFVALRARAEAGGLLPEDWSSLVREEEDGAGDRDEAGGDGDGAGGGRDGADGEAAAFRLRRFSIAGVTGEAHAVRAAELRAFVTGVRNVSGGTGFAITETPDPLVTTCGEGTELRVRVDLLSGGARARLRVEGADTALGRPRRKSVEFPTLAATAQGASGATGSERESFPHTATGELRLELPRQSVQYWTVEGDLPLDQPFLLDAAAVPGGGARVLVGRVCRLP